MLFASRVSAAWLCIAPLAGLYAGEALASRANPYGFTNAAQSSVPYTATPFMAAVDCAANPWMGCILVIRLPRVFRMRRPPIAVPQAIVRAQITFIQRATLNSGV